MDEILNVTIRIQFVDTFKTVKTASEQYLAGTIYDFVQPCLWMKCDHSNESYVLNSTFLWCCSLRCTRWFYAVIEMKAD